MSRRGFLWCLLFFLSGCHLPPFAFMRGKGPFLIEKSLSSLSLREKALLFEENIRSRHLTEEGLLAYAIDSTRSREGLPVSVSFGDMAIWTGCYAAAEAFRFSVTSEKEAYQRVIHLVAGLHLLQEITRQKGLLSRGIVQGEHPFPDGGEWHRGEGQYKDYWWLGDVSVDQVMGVIFGYSVAFDLITENGVRDRMREDTRQIVDRLLSHSMQIVDRDGLPTTHGDLGRGLFSEDLNALIALSIVKTAFHISGEETYQESYLDLIAHSRYHKRAVAARDKWWEHLLGTHHSDNNLAFLAYYPLLRYETDPSLLVFYRKSLERTWQAVREEGNPFFHFVYMVLAPERRDDRVVEEAIATLLSFPVDRRAKRVTNSTRRDVCRAWLADRFGRLQACSPLPIYERPADPFEWKENPYRLDGGGDDTILFSGVDYLLAYWMGRYHRFIPETL